jgi:hypothetical protein
LQPERQPQAVLGLGLELVSRPAAQECVGEGEALAGRDLEGDDLERGLACLPLEESGPGAAVCVNASHALVGRRDVEHDHVARVVGEDGVNVAGVDRLGPLLDEGADLALVCR